jgi:hypothetical protein
MTRWMAASGDGSEAWITGAEFFSRFRLPAELS